MELDTVLQHQYQFKDSGMAKNQKRPEPDPIDPQQHRLRRKVIRDRLLREQVIRLQFLPQSRETRSTTIEHVLLAIYAGGVQKVVKQSVVFHQDQHGVVQLVEFDHFDAALEGRTREGFFNRFVVVFVLDHPGDEVQMHEAEVLLLVLGLLVVQELKRNGVFISAEVESRRLFLASADVVVRPFLTRFFCAFLLDGKALAQVQLAAWWWWRQWRR